jgi:uncharacterized membrane protein
MIRHRWDGLALASILASTFVAALLYDRLPDPVPTHFDLSGHPNGWLPKAAAAWGMPLFALALWAIVRFVARLLPAGDRRRLTESALALVAMLTAVFVSGVHVTILYAAAVPGTSVLRPVFLLVGALFVALGLIMPRLRRNRLIGIRTVWTLSSDENWARTHRVAGYALVIGGVFGAVLGATGGPVGAALAVAGYLISALVPAVYSYVIAREGDAS